MKTGIVEANLVNLNQEFKLPYIQDLIDYKRTESEKNILKETNLAYHKQEYKRLQNELEIAFQDSHLPELPSAKSELNNLLLHVRQNQ